MKRLLWLPLLTLGVFAVAQDVAQTIDFSHTAAPTRTVLEALSKQTGVPLFVTGPAAQEIVLVSVKGVVLNDVLKRIAEVSSCEWKVEGDGFRLQPSAVVRNAEAKKERDARVAALRKQLSERVKALSPPAQQGPDNEKANEMRGMFGGNAAGKAVTRLLTQLDVGLLADLGRGQRIVFSTNPTRMQRPLGRNANAVIADLVREHNVEAGSMREMMGNAAMTDEERQALEFARQFMGQRDKVIEGIPTKALLIGKREQMFDALGVQILLFDAQGKVVLTADDNLMMGDLGGFAGLAELTGGGEPKPDEQKPDPDPTPIEFSALSKELSQYLGNAGMGASPFGKPMSRELRQALLRPDLRDPLAYASSEILLAIAAADKAQLVANLPDALADFTSLLGNAKPTVGQARAQAFEGDELAAETKDGWLLVRPAYPDANRKMRVDRTALARIIAVGERKGVPSLDDLAAYALACPPPMETPAAMPYLMLFAPNVMSQGMGGLQDWEMLRFYATLSQGQRQLLSDGGRISVPAMTLPQRDLVASMAFGNSAKLRVGAKPNSEGGGFMEMMRAFMPAPTNDYREEPTELMPTGLPPAAVLVLQNKALPIAVLASDPEGSEGGGMEQAAFLRGALGVDELSMLEYFRQDPNFSAVAGMMPQLGKVRVGKRAVYEFTFNLGPNVFMDRSLNDDAYDAASEPVAMDNLPQAFKDQIAKRVEALKKSPLPFGLGMGQRSVPPPR